MQALTLAKPVVDDAAPRLRLALPKGRMQQGVRALLTEAGIRVQDAGYRPQLSLEGVRSKLLKPQNIVEMLQSGSRDVGFAGADWVRELEADRVVELLDTELDPVSIVAAAPASLLVDGRLPRRPVVVASEYPRLTRNWIASRELDAVLIRSYGATEVFPPEDADCIVDNSATGTTLRDNGLVVFDELMRSSTRLYASERSLQRSVVRDAVDELVLLIRSVLAARARVMIELNVGANALTAVVDALPCMRQPTIARLFGDDGYAVRAAVPRERVASLIVELKARGGVDIVVTNPTQIVA